MQHRTDDNQGVIGGKVSNRLAHCRELIHAQIRIRRDVNEDAAGAA